MTSRSTSWSVVGVWTTSANPANATMPICVESLCLPMNDDAADSAASNRFGWMSVAHMLRETSIARMTVVRPAGTFTTWTGRASAHDQADKPEREQREGQVPTYPRRPTDRLAHERKARIAQGGLAAAQQPGPRDDEGHDGDQECQRPRCEEVGHGRRPNQRRLANPPSASRPRPAPAMKDVISVASGRMTKRVSMSS